MRNNRDFKNKHTKEPCFHAHINEDDKSVTISIEYKNKRRKTLVVHCYFLNRRQIKSLTSLLLEAVK